MNSDSLNNNDGVTSDKAQRPVCIVTGGSLGIGFAVCKLFSQNGYQVVNLDIRDFEETIDLNKAFETSMAIDVGHHPFATMEENPDFKKTKVLQGIPAAEFRRAEARRR